VESLETALTYFSRAARGVLGRELSSTERTLFHKYLNLILVWNRVHNLVGLRDPGSLVRVLFLESLLFRRLIPGGSIQVADIGSGAGVPGIPLRIVEPQMRLTLVESRRKKASFLSTLGRELGLDDVQIWQGRAEDLAMDNRTFDVVTMRAVASPDRCLEIGLPLLSSTGKLVASVKPQTSIGPMTHVMLGAGVEAEVSLVKNIEEGLSRKFLVAARTGRSASPGHAK
jgi:16S rRNA (guanine527-N7)-methyltransferase